MTIVPDLHRLGAEPDPYPIYAAMRDEGPIEVIDPVEPIEQP